MLRLLIETLDRSNSALILAQAVFAGKAAFNGGSSVIWNGILFETLVIPAKAGIQSVVGAFPMACGVDSRFRGNDCAWEHPCRANDTTIFMAERSPRVGPFVKDNQKSTYKRVVIHKLDHCMLKGYADSTHYVGPNGIEMLDREGRAVTVPLQEIKGVFFVKEFDGNPQRSERKLFLSRPRLAGLWVRMTFKDSEVLEGLLPNNLLELSPEGFLVTPSDLYSNNLRIFVPRTALNEISVLGVIADGRLKKVPQRTRALQPGATKTDRQIGLFPVPEHKD